MASRTSAGWRAASATRGQWRRTTPSGPTQTVERITPIVLRPYIVFSPQAPHCVMTFRSGSESRGNGSRCWAANLACDSAPSGEMPTTATPARWSSAQRSRKPQASLVQPGVLSRG